MGGPSSSAASFKSFILGSRPRKAERPPDKAEVSINAAICGASIHSQSSSLIFPVNNEHHSEPTPAPAPAPPPPSQHRRSVSMFSTRTRKTSSVSFSIGDKIETPSKPSASSSSTSLFHPGYSLLPATRSAPRFGGTVCESPMSSTLEVDRINRTSRKTSFKDNRRGSCPPVAFPASMAEEASETASIRSVPAPRSILKRSSDTASLRSFRAGDPTPSFDEARRTLEVYAEAAEEDEDDRSDVATTSSSLPAESIRKASPPASIMSTASRLSKMPKRAQTWVVDAGKGVTKSAAAMGTAILDTANPMRVQKRITLDEAVRPSRSQSQFAIADHILREKTKLPENQRDAASDYHMWNAERLNLNWKMKNKERVNVKEEIVEAEEEELSRPASVISLGGEPLYMTDSSAWLEHCDRVWDFTPQAVDLVNPHRPTLTKRSATLPNPPTQERITFTRRAQSEPTASQAAQTTADLKHLRTTSPEDIRASEDSGLPDTRFFKEDGKEINESPKSSLLLTPVSSNDPDAPGATWSQESLTSTASSSTEDLEFKEAKTELDWEKYPRLCDTDELDDELYNAVLNMTLTR